MDVRRAAAALLCVAVIAATSACEGDTDPDGTIGPLPAQQIDDGDLLCLQHSLQVGKAGEVNVVQLLPGRYRIASSRFTKGKWTHQISDGHGKRDRYIDEGDLMSHGVRVDPGFTCTDHGVLNRS
jgi:hypothetical protein